MEANGTGNFRFGEFEVDLDQRLLLRNGEMVKLSPKTFDLLSYFVLNPNRVISKDTLMAEVWSETVVEEANLSVHISHLRRVLGSGGATSTLIENFPRIGYRFNANVIELVKDSGPSETGFVGNAEGRPKIKQVVAGVVGLLAVASAGIVGFQAYQGAGSGLDRFRNLKVEKLTSHGKALFPEISPDGKFVAYGKDEGGKFSVWLRVVGSTSETEIVPPTEGLFYGAAFSPDGKTLFYRAAGELGLSLFYSMPLFGGGSNKLLVKGAYRLDISPSGNEFAFLFNDLPTGKPILWLEMLTARESEKSQPGKPLTITGRQTLQLGHRTARSLFVLHRTRTNRPRASLRLTSQQGMNGQ